MNSDQLAEFRRLVSLRARQFPGQWEASKKLMDGTNFPSTIARLHRAIQEKDLPHSVKASLAHVFHRQPSLRANELDGESLKVLTGLPPAKAIRALSVFFDLVPAPGSKWPLTTMSSQEIEHAVRSMENPFDLLGLADVASLLDLGAGDLSFAEELVDRYGVEPMQDNRPFILHCLDRLDPRSRLGGPLHVKRDNLQKLQRKQGLSFSFFGDQNMFELQGLDEQGLLAPRYTIAVCWAPATPTFAYEPTRLSPALITQELERTKGVFRSTHFGKEPALEVQHGDRVLLFPPWKFDIVGPCALLNLMARRACISVLGAVDAQVFWELLAQLLDDPCYRPQDVPFNATTLPKVFGKVYDALHGLPIGATVELADLATLRQEHTHLPSTFDQESPTGTFRYVRISRGAVFPGIPASSTARKFSAMTEEVPPWLVTLVST